MGANAKLDIQLRHRHAVFSHHDSTSSAYVKLSFFSFRSKRSVPERYKNIRKHVKRKEPLILIHNFIPNSASINLIAEKFSLTLEETCIHGA